MVGTIQAVVIAIPPETDPRQLLPGQAIRAPVGWSDPPRPLLTGIPRGPHGVPAQQRARRQARPASLG